MASQAKIKLFTRQNNLLKRKEELEKEIDKLIRFINNNLFNKTDINVANTAIQRVHNEIVFINKTLGEIGAKLSLL